MAKFATLARIFNTLPTQHKKLYNGYTDVATIIIKTQQTYSNTLYRYCIIMRLLVDTSTT